MGKMGTMFFFCKKSESFYVQPAVADISLQILLEFYCFPVNNPECLCWSLQSTEVWHPVGHLWHELACL
jgi:hypothetical protein